jgi:hypothetical protein
MRRRRVIASEAKQSIWRRGIRKRSMGIASLAVTMRPRRMTPKAIADWLAMAASKDYAGLDRLLAEEVVFRSPVVHAPQKGRAITTQYLASAMRLLGNANFRYVETWFSARSAVLEFETELEGLYINGVDIIHWDDEDKVTSFKVMVRPLKAINILHQAMATALQAEN